MHGWETRMLLKHYLDRGVSKAELSRRFGVSRRTIHEWVVTGQLDRDLSSGGSRYSPRPPVPHKLDRYAGIIDSRLEEFPGLSAQRLFDEVRAAGYAGGYGRVRDYVRAVRPRELPEPVVRFETPAGHQGQVDFATFTLPWGRRYALVVVLSHSRLLWLCFYPRQTMAVLTGGLETAFERFGGVPKELLFDQMRAVVQSDRRVGGGELVLNAEFLRFAAHWRFHPRACRPYRARTKSQASYYAPSCTCDTSSGYCRRSRNRFPGWAVGSGPVGGSKSIVPLSSARTARSTPWCAKRLAVAGCTSSSSAICGAVSQPAPLRCSA